MRPKAHCIKSGDSELRIGLVVDSTCDLPMEYIKQHGIEVMPIGIRVGPDEIIDARKPNLAAEFYRSEIGRRGVDAESVPFDTREITDLFLDELVGKYDFVFCETVMRSRSPIFENATKASFRILSEYRPRREEAGCDAPFAMRVFDTGTAMAGQAVIAAETARLIEQGLAAPEIRHRIEHMCRTVRAYAIPQDIYYLRSRARKKGDRSLTWSRAVLASALDIKPILQGRRNHTDAIAQVRGFENAAERVFRNVQSQVEKGLESPFVCLSYAGDLELMRMLPGYPELVTACAKNEVELLETVMSVTGGVNLGPGTLSAGMLAKGHKFQ